MQKNIRNLFFLSMLLFSCWSEEGAASAEIAGMKVFHNDKAAYFHQGGLRFDQKNGRMISRGVVYAFDEKGVLRSILNFDEQEKQSGVQLAFDEKGITIRLETWRAGVLDGDWIDFEQMTGLMAEHRKYVQGKQMGASTIFDDSGKPRRGKTEEERNLIPRF